jgi:hypothetical protein
MLVAGIRMFPLPWTGHIRPNAFYLIAWPPSRYHIKIICIAGNYVVVSEEPMQLRTDGGI